MNCLCFCILVDWHLILLFWTLQFSQWYRHQRNTQHVFPDLVLFTDETCFTCEAKFNGRNCHEWDNIKSTCELAFELVFVSDHLTGPYLLPARFNVYIHQQVFKKPSMKYFRACHSQYNRCSSSRMEHQQTTLVLSTISRMLHLLSVTRDGAEQTYGLRDYLTDTNWFLSMRPQ